MAIGHNDPLRATLTGIADLFRRTEQVRVVGQDERLDGLSALVTGATSGLGRAVAIDLLRRGARVVAPARSRVGELPAELTAASGGGQVTALPVDLADLDSVSALADTLRDRGERLDLVILNAGLMPRSTRLSAQGFEVMVAVHFLANRLLLDRLLSDGVVVPGQGPSGRVPRVVLVASNSHQSAGPVDWERLARPVEYGMTTGMAQYAHSKLLMVLLAQASARRLSDASGARVAVHSLCPGPVATNIGREAPAWLRPALSAVMAAAFTSPARAAVPVVTLAAAPWLEGKTGLYYHLRRDAQVSAIAADVEQQRLAVEQSSALLGPWLPPQPALVG